MSLTAMALKRKRPCWPEPEKSVGRRYPYSTSSGFMWEAVGPACDAFKDICPEINKLLETWSEELAKGEDGSPAFSYGIWMVGRDPAHAIPTIILGCVSRRVRTRAEAIIKQSGLLRPGIAIKKAFATPQPLTLERPPLPRTRRCAYAAPRNYGLGGAGLALSCSSSARSRRVYRARSRRVYRLNLAPPTRSWEKYGSSMAHDFAYHPLFNGFSLGPGLILQFDSDEESDESCLFEDTKKGYIPQPEQTLFAPITIMTRAR